METKFAQLRSVRNRLGDLDYRDHDILSKALTDLLGIIQESKDGEISASYDDGTLGIRAFDGMVEIVDIEESRSLLTITLTMEVN
jgi:hypothetical protein